MYSIAKTLQNLRIITMEAINTIYTKKYIPRKSLKNYILRRAIVITYITTMFATYTTNTYADNKYPETIATNKVSISSNELGAINAGIKKRFDITDCKNYGNGLWSNDYDGEKYQAILFPDEYADYWMAAVPVIHTGAHIEIDGYFPKARFMGIYSYGGSKGENIDAIMDREIIAEFGSVNPYKNGASYPADSENAQYFIKIEDQIPALRNDIPNTNTLWGGFLSDGQPLTANQLVYRIYLGEDNNIEDLFDHNLGGVPLPRLYYVIDNPITAPYKTLEEVCQNLPEPAITTETLAEYEHIADANAESVYLDMPYDAPDGYAPYPTPEWFISANMVGSLSKAFPQKASQTVFQESLNKANFDSEERDIESGFYINTYSAYLSSYLNPDFGDVMVMRFKMPRTPSTELGESVDTRGDEGDQTRYISVCIHQLSNYMYLYDCIYDSQIEVDSDGYAVFAFSTTALLNSDGSAYYKNWLPYSSSTPIAVLRHMGPTVEEKNSIAFQESPVFFGLYPSKENPENDPFDSKQVALHMQEYYPESVYCSQTEWDDTRCGYGWED